MLIDYSDAGEILAGQAEPLYYLKDTQGSVGALADAGGNVVERYTYDPYGQTYITDAQATQPPLTASEYAVCASWRRSGIGPHPNPQEKPCVAKKNAERSHGYLANPDRTSDRIIAPQATCPRPHQTAGRRAKLVTTPTTPHRAVHQEETQNMNNELKELYQSTEEDMLFGIGVIELPGCKPTPYFHTFYRDWPREKLEVVRESFSGGLVLTSARRADGTYDLRIATSERITLG